MHISKIFSSKSFASFFILMFLGLSGYTQAVTKVTGKINDASTGEPLIFVDVGFVGTYVGTNTDDVGKYTLESRFGSDTIYISYLGYVTQKIKVKKGQSQVINVSLRPESYVMESVTIVEKKTKYRKKNNPAIELAKKITRNKRKNQLKSLPYYSYDQHEKIRLDLNNITDDFKERSLMKTFDYAWEYIDTSELNGRTYLPLFFKETLSEVNYRKRDDKLRERQVATKYTEFFEDWDAGSVGDIMSALYQDIDIYENDMSVNEMQFTSPLSTAGPNFYRYYIMDTLDYKGRSVIHLAFIPAVKGNRGFTGYLYVTNDDRYTVVKVDMGVVKNINVNFIRDLKIVQEFEPVDTNYVKTKDELVLDYALTKNGVGFFGTRSVSYDNFSFDKPDDESVFSGIEKIVRDDSLYLRNDDYWEANRIEKLNNEEEKAYELVNKMVQDKYYRIYVYLTSAAANGYLGAGPFEFGVLATFYSFNEVEGRNLRFGGRTTYKVSEKMVFRGSIAHAQRTDVWKYNASYEYSFNNRWKENPRHYIRLSTEKTNSFPGQELEFFSPDNVLLSFRRGRASDMILSEKYDFRYVNEGNGFNYTLGAQRIERNPYGTMQFLTEGSDGGVLSLNNINSSELYTTLRYAPNETFIQGKEGRTQLYNEYPIIELRINQGLSGIFSDDYTFTRAYLNVFKQIEWTRIGTTDIIFEGGKIFGEVPYLLTFIPRGNQTYANFKRSFNMMNFMEFANDQFLSINIEHFSYGYFLNRIPLIKRLQLREVFGLKAYYGGLTSINNPNKNPNLIQFVRDDQNVPITYTMDGIPYVEANFGLTNIFKIFRVDIIKRFTHLDNPRLPSLFGTKGMGIRFNFQVEL